MMPIYLSLMRGNIQELIIEGVSLPHKSGGLPYARISGGIWYLKVCQITIFLCLEMEHLPFNGDTSVLSPLFLFPLLQLG